MLHDEITDTTVTDGISYRKNILCLGTSEHYYANSQGKAVFSWGKGGLSRAYEKRELVLKSDFSQPCGLQCGLTLRSGAGVCWEVFHEIMEQ